MWDLGQQHLAAGLYVSARTHLESAEAILWRNCDMTSLARIYLPLLEVRRQLRHLAVDGYICLAAPGGKLDAPLAGVVTEVPTGVLVADDAKTARKILIASRRLLHPYDALLLVRDRQYFYLTTLADPCAAAGLRVTRAASTQDFVDPEIRPEMTIPLPEPGAYSPQSPEHAQARESLLVAWEALALKWQSRHPARATPWGELAHCRAALRVDPACEPITMRLIAIAEKMSRG